MQPQKALVTCSASHSARHRFNAPSSPSPSAAARLLWPTSPAQLRGVLVSRCSSTPTANLLDASDICCVSSGPAVDDGGGPKPPGLVPASVSPCVFFRLSTAGSKDAPGTERSPPPASASRLLSEAARSGAWGPGSGAWRSSPAKTGAWRRKNCATRRSHRQVWGLLLGLLGASMTGGQTLSTTCSRFSRARCARSSLPAAELCMFRGETTEGLVSLRPTCVWSLDVACSTSVSGCGASSSASPAFLIDCGDVIKAERQRCWATTYRT